MSMQKLSCSMVLGCVFIAGVCSAATSAAASSPRQSGASDRAGQPLSPVMVKNWARGLQSGPNGPIPAIVVDQFGYPPNSRKIAIIRQPIVGYDTAVNYQPSTNYALIDLSNGSIVKRGALKVWQNGNVHANSGDKVWWFDFSDVRAPGRYVVADIDKTIRSAEFQISNGVYGEVMVHAVRMFFYQRAGFHKSPDFAGKQWADAASHIAPGQDREARPWPKSWPKNGPSRSPGPRNLSGGWYDAGDYNRYTTWTARNIIVLLRAFEENPQAFSDGIGIPESGNGVPDLLDELIWGLNWLVRMQLDDGSILCVQGVSSASPPSAARGRSFYGPPTTSASLMAAAAMAYGSRVFSRRPERHLKDFADRLATRANAAWTWASANPAVTYYNNDEARQPGSKGLAHGQQELSDTERQSAKVEAAIYLFALSGKPSLKRLIETSAGALMSRDGPTLWHVDREEALLFYAGLPGVSARVRARIRDRFLARMTPRADAFERFVARSAAYRAPLKDFTWGSNKAMAMQARLFQLTARVTSAAATQANARAAALDYVHYIHGVNPLGLVYLSNMTVAGAEHSATTIFHAWFAKGTRWERVGPQMAGPPPGYVVGGPTPQYSLDQCCKAPGARTALRCFSRAAAAVCKRRFAPPLGQPPMKSYLQFNDPWPANSWVVSEPSTNYQAYYIRLLAAFVG